MTTLARAAWVGCRTLLVLWAIRDGVESGIEAAVVHLVERHRA